jgi:predicted SAM-dependent methyltransferase
MKTSTSTTVIAALLLTLWAVASTWALPRAGLPESVRRWFSESSAPRKIEAHLASHDVRKLQIGAGPNNLDGWLNTDIEPRAGQVFLDASKPFPIPDSSIHYIYAEQVIEHIPFDGGMTVLRESHRVLVPGGILRIATPDLARLLALFDERSSPEEERFMQAQLKMSRLNVAPRERPLFILNTYLQAWGHRFLYDPQTLGSAAQIAGFREVQFKRHRESDHTALANVERHIDIIGRDIDEYVTMIVEVTK